VNLATAISNNEEAQACASSLFYAQSNRVS